MGAREEMVKLLLGAAKPVEKAGVAQVLQPQKLPMDEISRLRRATEQGFTRDAYRGEGAPISGSSLIERHPGRYDPGFLGGDAIYSTNAPRLANDYTIFKAYREAEPAPNVMPLKVRMNNPRIISGEEKSQIAKLNAFERDDWLRDTYKSGHDGVLVKYPGGYEEYVAPATNYRSRFATFDPEYAAGGGANLMSGVAGAAIAAPVMSKLFEPQVPEEVR